MFWILIQSSTHDLHIILSSHSFSSLLIFLWMFRQVGLYVCVLRLENMFYDTGSLSDLGLGYRVGTGIAVCATTSACFI